MTEQGTAREGPALGMAAGVAAMGLPRPRDDEAGGRDCPPWVPAAARDYLAHVEGGRTIRSIAREEKVHPSTILRRVRRVEASRDDPLVDSALRRLSGGTPPAHRTRSVTPRPKVAVRPAGTDIEEDALPLLRRLSEPGATLAVARDMENGVILREGPGGEPQRLAVVARDVAEAMALRQWIACADPAARIRRYALTPLGRSLLRRGLAEASRELAESALAFDDGGAESDLRLRHMRSLLPESPLAALARRRDGEGAPFLNREQVAAGERLREDFEIATQGGLAVPWDKILARPAGFEAAPPGGQHRPDAAVARVARAIGVLGEGLADVALGCCGHLEGIETLERRLGWSARSGKVVLRIALDRLRRHYRDEEARGGSLIG